MVKLSDHAMNSYVSNVFALSQVDIMKSLTKWKTGYFSTAQTPHGVCGLLMPHDTLDINDRHVMVFKVRTGKPLL